MLWERARRLNEVNEGRSVPTSNFTVEYITKWSTEEQMEYLLDKIYYVTKIYYVICLLGFGKRFLSPVSMTIK